MDIIKRACAGLIQKIQSGEAPDEIVTLYQNMGPQNFGYWLHGFYSGYSKKIESHSAKMCLFLKGVLADYEGDVKDG